MGAVKGMTRNGKQNIANLQDNKPKTPEQFETSKNVQEFLLKLRLNKPEKPKTPEELEDRFNNYFELCSIEGLPPTVEGLGLVSGWARSTFYEIAEGRQNKEFMDIAKSAKDYVCSYDGMMAAAGKVQPATYIFRAKNFYDMTDEQKIKIEAQPGADKPNNVDDIVQALPEAPNADFVGEIVE